MIVEATNPLSLTSDKSSEAYRNWWPGPDRSMTAFMNRSIDLMEGHCAYHEQSHPHESPWLRLRDR